MSLFLLFRYKARFLLGQGAALRAGQLGSQVEGKILLLFVEEAQLVTLSRVDDSENTGNRFADIVAVWRYSSVLSLFPFPGRAKMES